MNMIKPLGKGAVCLGIAAVGLAGAALATAPTTAAHESGTPVFPYGDFHNVPQLGSEPVRGSGCGGNGQIGEFVPDGIWAGFVPEISGGAVKIDLLCVYTPSAATGIINEGTANIIYHDPDYLIVNNSTRLRVAPTSPHMFELRDAVPTPSGGCVEGPFLEGVDHFAYQAWINIEGGAVTWIIWGCQWLGGSGASLPNGPIGPSGPSGNLPPAFPDPYNPAATWPYGEFWNVPQLGSERVRGSGCGGSGEVGDRIPNGLWAGYVSLDPATNQFWIDLLCVYHGDSAAAVVAAGTANIVKHEPDYLIVNNNARRRTLTNNVQAVMVSAMVDGRCVPTASALPAPGAGQITGPHPWIDGFGANQAWIRVHNGSVTWILYGCDTGFVPGG